MDVDKSKPGKVVVEVLRRNTLESIHPLLEAAMKGVNVLDVINPLDHAAVAFHVQLFVVNPGLVRENSPGSICIATNGWY